MLLQFLGAHAFSVGLVILLIAGLPIAFVLGVTAAVMIMLDPAVVPQIMGLIPFGGANNYLLVAALLFMSAIFPRRPRWVVLKTSSPSIFRDASPRAHAPGHGHDAGRGAPKRTHPSRHHCGSCARADAPDVHHSDGYHL